MTPRNLTATVEQSEKDLGQSALLTASPRSDQATSDQRVAPVSFTPRVTDNDKGEITVTLNGRELRGWSYTDEFERRQKMMQAREYVEGWCDAASEIASDRAAERAVVEAGYAPLPEYVQRYGDKS